MQVLVNILLVVNVFVCVALIAIVLLQRSEGGGLGMGSGGGGGGFMTARGAGDLLTRTTWILAFVFFGLCLALTLLTARLHGGMGSIVDHINLASPDLSSPQGKTAPSVPAPTGAAPPPALQAPTPQAQTPQTQAPSRPDPLAAFGTPQVQLKPQSPSSEPPAKK